MAYSPSPKPDYKKNTFIKFSNLKIHLWGDKVSGYVKDWIYVSNKSIHQIIFGIKPGSNFKHSNEYRTIFGADEFLYVLSGTLIISNPQTGEIHKVEEGQSVFFRKDTWHHAFNYSNKELQVLEFFSPPPLTGTSGAYAKKKPFLKKNIYQKKILEYPNINFKKENSFFILNKEDIIWSLYGPNQELLFGTYVKTKYLKVNLIKLKPGQKSPPISFIHDVCFLSLNDNIIADIPGHEKSLCMKFRDTIYLKSNNEIIMKNKSKKEAEIIMCEGLI